MTLLKITAALGLLCLPLPGLALPASAATAHNSQAGANGPTSNNQARTYRHLRSGAKRTR